MLMKFLLLYYWRHPLKTALFLMTLAIGTSGLLVANSIIHSYRDTQEIIFNQGQNWVELNSLNSSQLHRVHEIVAAQPGVDTIVFAKRYSLSYPLFGVARAALPLYTLADNELATILIRRTGNILTNGRPPCAAGEAAIPIDLAKARGLKLGDIIGADISEEDAKIGAPARVRIVGLLKGNTTLAIMLDSKEEDGRPYLQSVIIFGRELSKLEKFLQASIGPQVFVYGPESRLVQRRARIGEYARIAVLLTLIIGIAIALGVTIIDWLDFTIRLPEQTLLQFIGWKRSGIMLRSFCEITVRSFIGWLFGLVFGISILQTLKEKVFTPRGMHMFWSSQDLFFSVTIPLLAIIINIVMRASTTKYDPVLEKIKSRQRTIA